VRRLIDEMTASYRIDRARVVLHGAAAGGSMAYLVGLNEREAVRGIAVVDAAVPLGASPPQTDPLRPLAFYCATSSGSPLALRMSAEIERLRELEFPVTDVEVAGGSLSDSQREELARWIDSHSLDRI
jgi:hypothetical protein